MKPPALCPVTENRTVAPGIHLLAFESAEVSRSVLAGQFVNLRVGPGMDPLLRRPFSVHQTSGDSVRILFRIVGRGTALLASLRPGDMLDVLGPLGTPYGLTDPRFETALLVAGGLGVAPMPLAADALRRLGKPAVAFVGARTAQELVDGYLADVHAATDDGTRGHRGTVVDLLERSLAGEEFPSPRIFACGPNPMLAALAALALRRNIPCEVSLEGPMGCGFGICQGCPVELSEGEKRYALMCTDGPVFDVRRIRIPA